MATITIGKNAGNYNLDVSDMNLDALSDPDSHRTVTLGNLAKDNSAKGTILFETNKEGLSLEVEGTFFPEHLRENDRSGAVKEIHKAVLTEDGDISFTITNFDLTGKNLKNAATFDSFILNQKYTINGNNGANEIYGGGNDDKLYGNGGNDRLFGDAGNDQLFGGAGNDRLTGGAGKNILNGGDGNDTYYISAGDKIVEAKGKAGGIDTVVASSNADLDKFNNVENLILVGNKNIKGYGDEGNNIITGNGGANTLAGGRGNDTLSGGKGIDHFIFAKGDKIDTITDFDATGKDHETIELDGFGKKFKFANLDIEKHGNGVDIDLGHGDHLILEHVKIKDIDASDFQF